MGWLSIIFIFNSLLSSKVVQHAKDRPTLALPRFAAPLAMLCTVNLCQLSVHKKNVHILGILASWIRGSSLSKIQAMLSRTQAENLGLYPLEIKMEPKKSSNKKDVFQQKKCEANLHFCVFHLNFRRVYVVCVWDSWRSQPESNSPCFSWPPSKPRLGDLSSCDPCKHHASQSLCMTTGKSHIAILLMEDILYHLICSESHRLQGFYIISQVVNLVNGINYISSGTGCLPSSVVLRFVSHIFIIFYICLSWLNHSMSGRQNVSILMSHVPFKQKKWHKREHIPGLSVIACGGIRHRNSSLETYSAVMKAKAPS